MAQKFHVKRNDVVVVISGSHKGKTGKILEVLPAKQRARPRTEPVMAFLERYGTIGMAWWGTSSRTVAKTSSSISADGCPNSDTANTPVYASLASRRSSVPTQVSKSLRSTIPARAGHARDRASRT